MSRLVKIVNNKYVQIEEYKNPNICFNTNEYDNFEDYCTLRETFDPFEIFYENQELKSQLKGTTHCFDEEEHRKLKDEIKELERIIELCHLDAKETLATINCEQENQQKEFINYLQKEINRYTTHIEAIDSVCTSIYSSDYDNSKIKLAIYK